MYKYLVNCGGEKKIFFSKPYGGIFELTKKGSVWAYEKSIFSEACDVFFAYGDKDGVIHIITVTKSDMLLYLRFRDNEWQSFEVCRIVDGMKIKKIMMGENEIGKNLFYSAQYQDDTILVHCVLGDNAKPSTIDNLFSDNFFVSDKRVYYTNSDGEMGYKSFDDGKPAGFVKCDVGQNPYYLKTAKSEYLIYEKNKSIFVNGEKYCSDRAVDMPIIVKNADVLTLMWINGDFIKYAHFDEDSKGKKPMRYVSAGAVPDLYVLSNGQSCTYYYGILSGGCLKFFANADPFRVDINDLKDSQIYMQKAEITNLKNSLVHLKREIEVYKSEIVKLNDMIDALKNVNFKTKTDTDAKNV